MSAQSRAQALTVCGLTAPPGEVVRGQVPVGYYPDGTAVHMPLLLMNGRQPGPVMLLTAGMHGPEVPGIEVLRRLLRETLTPADLHGSIIAVPVMNPFSFHQHQMITPQDGFNLNRVFPGNARGFTTHRLAHLVCDQILPHADYVLDFHANPEPAMQFALVRQGDDGAAWEQSVELAHAFGITTIEMLHTHEEHRSATLAEIAGDLGKPAVIIELVSWRRIVPEGIEAGVRGAMNVLRHLGMWPGDPEPQTVPVLPRLRLTRMEVTADHGGIIYPRKAAGEQIQQGEVIAVIRDVFGETVEEVRSPRDGWLLAWPWIHNQAVTTGDFLAFIAFPIG